LNRTWSIAPQHDVPWQGRERESSEGFALPGYTLCWQGDALQISTGQLRVTVHQPLWLSWEYLDVHGQWQPLASDRPTGAYLLNMHGDGVAHYQRRTPQERCYGLGEKAGDLNRAGRRFEFRNLDAMGYNAQNTDPLYKHLPFTIVNQPGANYGVFYDNLSSTWLDLGNEIDNYHPAYRRYQAEAGDLDYYFLRHSRCDQSVCPAHRQNLFRPQMESRLQRFHHALHRRAGRSATAVVLHRTVSPACDSV